MVEIARQKLEMVSLDRLRPHPANPRRGDVNAVRASMEAHGFYGAVVVQRATGHILAGNHRYYAAVEAGMDAIPAFFLDVDDEQAMRILLADNRTSDLGTYDFDALAQLLDHLASTDQGLDGLGYDERMLNALAASVEYEHEDGVRETFDATAYWVDMPEYEATPDAVRLTIRFKDKGTRDEFVRLHGIRITAGAENRAASAWWPEMDESFSSKGEGRHDG